MSSKSPNNRKRFMNRADHEQLARKAAYMAQYRTRLDVRERPEARAVDRSIVGAILLMLDAYDPPIRADLLRVLAARASDGLEREGYDRSIARDAIISRIEGMAEDGASPVVEAFRARTSGRSHIVGRVRHEDRL